MSLWLLLLCNVSCLASVYYLFQDTVRTSNLDAQLPLQHFNLSSGFGYRLHPVTGEKNSFHRGIDIRAKNEIVSSVLDGVVVKIAYQSIMGNYVVVKHGRYAVYYAHLSKVYCISGQKLFSGYPLGLTGSTGRTTGEHLHLSVKYNGLAINPLYFLLNILSRSGEDLLDYLSR